MASNAPGDCCTRGFKHEGNPTGETKQINGTKTYLSYPEGNQNPEYAVLFLTDVVGIYSNSQLLADAYAANGYLTMVPDLFHGNPWELNATGVDLMDWLKNHQPQDVDPIVEAAIKFLREQKGVKKIAAVGYCFGAKYVCRFLKESKIDVGYVAHPSFVTSEELSAITGPLSIAAAETDNIFPATLRHESEDILRKTGVPYQINLYSGVEHGFAVRGDLSKRQIRFAKEQAFSQAVTWFKWHL